jgi:hypothetical protein
MFRFESIVVLILAGRLLLASAQDDAETFRCEVREPSVARRSPNSIPSVSGQQRVAFIMVNLLDASLFCSSGDVHRVLFEGPRSMAGLIAEMSYSNVTVSGDVLGPFTINSNGRSRCAPDEWADAADAAATQSGVNLDQYDLRCYVLPDTIGCNWEGLADLGGIRSWVNACSYGATYAHELGHNFGMNHASTDANNDGVKDCEYCDRSCIMGFTSSDMRHANAPHKVEMGWLPAGKTVTLTTNAILQISPLALFPGTVAHPQVLTIPVPGGDQSYFFSYRRKHAYDVVLSQDYADRTSVHRHKGTGNTYFIKSLSDFAPGSGGQPSYFLDAANKIYVAQIQRTAESVTLQAAFDCVPEPPQLTASLPELVGQRSESLTYHVTIRNLNNPLCADSFIHITADAPEGWTVAVNPASVSLKSFSATPLLVTVTPAQTATNGIYPVILRAANERTGFLALTHHVQTADDLAVTKVRAPGRVTTGTMRPVRVRIQNRCSYTLTIPDAGKLAGMVQLNMESPGTCPLPLTALADRKQWPVRLRPKQSMNVVFQVTFDCANDPQRNEAGDFAFGATATLAVLDGFDDQHVTDDRCPRNVTGADEVDEFPDGKIRDRGCARAITDVVD